METPLPVTERTVLTVRLARLTAAHDTAADAYEQLVNWPGAGKDEADPVALAPWRRRLDELYAIKDDLAGQRSAVLRRLRATRRGRPEPVGAGPRSPIRPGSVGCPVLWRKADPKLWPSAPGKG